MLYFLIIRMIASHKKFSKTINTTKDYKCKFCKASFQHFENLRLHQQLNHHTDREDCCKFFGK